jgi:lipoprotein-anchoring transpeptidase ErfK/SrfK
MMRQELESVRKSMVLAICLAAASSGPAYAQPSGTSAKPPVDINILHVQVILDHLGFSPGILDGRGGRSLVAALKGFQQTRGLSRTGKIDPATLWALHAYRALRPIKRLILTGDSLAGPFVNPMPKDPTVQARLPAMAYRDPAEKLAESFHTTPEVLAELNPDVQIKPGAVLRLPNALPTSRAYAGDLKPDWRATLNMLNVDANQPRGARIVVDKSEKTLSVYDDAGRLVALFSATMGSSHDPLPIGNWKIQGADYNPKFSYNAELFWDAKNPSTRALLPPGPNGPVGVVWLDLNKPHYGIHGTSEPQTIGRSESHGCIRLTNWDVARLALMVKPGTPAVFQE